LQQQRGLLLGELRFRDENLHAWRFVQTRGRRVHHSAGLLHLRLRQRYVRRYAMHIGHSALHDVGAVL
jgi:hypothetical protein